MNKRYVFGILTVALLLAGPVGCGKKELEELRVKSAQLEKDLASANARLADKDKEVEDARAASDAQVKSLTEQLTKTKVERDKLKQELAALKRKKR